MERSLRYIEVLGQRNYWPMSKLIIKRCSKPRPVPRKSGCCKEKTEAAFEFKNRKSEALRKESLENTNS